MQKQRNPRNTALNNCFWWLYGWSRHAGKSFWSHEQCWSSAPVHPFGMERFRNLATCGKIFHGIIRETLHFWRTLRRQESAYSNASATCGSFNIPWLVLFRVWRLALRIGKIWIGSFRDIYEPSWAVRFILWFVWAGCWQTVWRYIKLVELQFGCVLSVLRELS